LIKTIAALLCLLFAGCGAQVVEPGVLLGTPEPTDAAQPIQGGAHVVCQRRETEAAETATGQNAILMGVAVVPNDRPIFVRNVEVDFGWNGRALYGNPFGNETGRPYFTEWFLTADYPFRVFNTEPGELRPNGTDRRGTARINTDWTSDPITEATYFRIHSRIAETEEGHHTLTLGRYTTRLTGLTLVYGDTNEIVPAAEISYEDCDDPDAFQTFVRPNFADLLAQQWFAFQPTEVHGSATDHPTLQIAFTNDGIQPGTLNRFAVESHAMRVRNDGTEEAMPSDSLLQGCSLFQGEQHLTEGVRNGDFFTFQDFQVTLPALADQDDVLVEIRCTYNASALNADESAWIALSAPYQGFGLSEPAPARISGTLVLEQNHLHAENRIAVTIRPGPNERGCWPVNPNGLCTPGCYYHENGLPYATDIDPVQDRCAKLCSLDGTLLSPESCP
jgi:hypothetical protein